MVEQHAGDERNVFFPRDHHQRGVVVAFATYLYRTGGTDVPARLVDRVFVGIGLAVRSQLDLADIIRKSPPQVNHIVEKVGKNQVKGDHFPASDV